MKQSLTSLSFGIALVVSITLNASSLMGQKDATRCPAGVKQMLDRAASTALEAIKQGQPKTLMPLLSQKGVVLGVDGPLVRLVSIRKEISAKTGIYCVIFDSSCLMKEVNASLRNAGAPVEHEEVLSFRDHLLKRDLVVKTTLDDSASFCGGMTRDSSPSFELDWEWTPVGWKIVAIPYL